MSRTGALRDMLTFSSTLSLCIFLTPSYLMRESQLLYFDGIHMCFKHNPVDLLVNSYFN